MKIHRVLLATALALGVVGVAQANPVAMIYKVEGKVMVNQGQKFLPAKTGMPLSVGDRVMVMPGSQVMLDYGSGCSMTLAPNSTFIVTPNCQPTLAAVGGSDAASSGTNYTPLIAVGGVVVLAALVAGGGGSSSTSNPISP
ncbi:hypothetical protein [Metallibacterium scheffleri]|uniref:hypothetical protein n=1 Tax=Metallibacterium scheffleri TaxID=993689 RepID=UPI0023F40245|nr:hypothetical protein [Metallibacterium scheffleri]